MLYRNFFATKQENDKAGTLRTSYVDIISLLFQFEMKILNFKFEFSDFCLGRVHYMVGELLFRKKRTENKKKRRRLTSPECIVHVFLRLEC